MSHTGNSPTEAIQYLSVEQVLTAHAELIKRYGGNQGVRDRGLLESEITLWLREHSRKRRP